MTNQQALGVGKNGNDITLSNAIPHATLFTLNESKANETVEQIKQGLSQWHSHFKSVSVLTADLNIPSQLIDPKLGRD